MEEKSIVDYFKDEVKRLEHRINNLSDIALKNASREEMEEGLSRL